MNNRQCVMVALSLTEHDIALMEYARLLAESGLGREFRFVHVGAKDAPDGAHSELDRNMQATVAKHFGPDTDHYFAGCDVIAGVRVDALLGFAAHIKASVILLGHRRLRSGRRSLARHLAMISPSSVWMVPEGAACSLKRIVAPVDLSQNSADGLQVALDIAGAAKSEQCLALHVVAEERDDRSPQVSPETRSALDKFLTPFDEGIPRPTPRLESGSFAAPTILRVVNELQADLVVMNTRGRSTAAAILLGSITEQVLIETPVACLAVKHSGAMLGLFEALTDSRTWTGRK